MAASAGAPFTTEQWRNNPLGVDPQALRRLGEENRQPGSGPPALERAPRDTEQTKREAFAAQEARLQALRPDGWGGAWRARASIDGWNGYVMPAEAE